MLTGTLGGRVPRQPARIARLAVLCFTFFAVAAPSAHATLRVVNHNDPAGDPTLINYRLSSSTNPAVLVNFALHDGEDKSFGVLPGTYTVQALLPSGWQ